MINKNVIQRGLTLGLALALGLALTLSLLVGMAVAQGSDDAFIAPEGTDTYWLVFDTAQPVEQTLPELLAALAQLKTQAQVVDYDPTPHTSGPDAVPGVQVAVRPGFEIVLEGLPGVLYVGETLPPAPSEGGILATTIITGRVTEVVNPANPIATLQVNAYDGLTAQFLASVPGDVDGFYSITVDPASNQAKLFFDDFSGAHVDEWYNDKSSFNSANPITATGATITNINAQLASANAALTGTVRFTPTNQLVDGAFITLRRASDGGTVNSFFTGADGIFTFTNLATGVYKVQAGGSVIAPEFYQDVPFNFGDLLAGVAAATPVTVTGGATQSIAMLVDPTAVITGLVTNTVGGGPIAFAGNFSLFDPAGNPISTVGTDGAGEYQFRGFGSGTYEILFDVFGFNRELYNNIPAASGFPPSNLNQATPVTATTGQTRTNINAGLTPNAGVLITGTVTSFTSTALANVQVLLNRLNPATGQYFFFDFTNTNASGEYVFPGFIAAPVSDGSYKVAVGFGSSPIIPHAAEWFNNANVITPATTITVTGGISQTSKNVQLALGGCLAGKLVDAATGLPVGGAGYQVRQVENGNQPISVIPNGGPFWTPFPSSSFGPPPLETGEFLACGLPTGAYILDCGQQITATVTAPGVTTGGLVCKVDQTVIYLPLILK